MSLESRAQGDAKETAMRKERARHTTDGARWAFRAPKGRAVLVATVILGAAFGTAAWAQTAFDLPAVFSAATLAAPNLLTGPGFAFADALQPGLQATSRPFPWLPPWVVR